MMRAGLRIALHTGAGSLRPLYCNLANILSPTRVSEANKTGAS